jgi:hypothetical protein
MPMVPQKAPAESEGAEVELKKDGAAQEGGPQAGAKEGGEEGEGPGAAGPQAGAKEGAQQGAQKAQLQLLADAGAYYAGIPATANVGHAWVRIVSGDHATSWGFWPVGKMPLQGLTPTPGEVRSPDEGHSPTAMHTYDISGQQAEKATEKAAEIKKSPPDYNLFNHNCVWFAAQVAEAAGVSPPNFRGILGIANPNALAAGLTELNKKSGENAMQQPLPPPDEKS